MIKRHPSYIYADNVVKKKVIAGSYVIKQCQEFKDICDGKVPEYTIDEHRVMQIGEILKLISMPKGLKMGRSIYECLAGFQWLLIVAALCVVETANPEKRRYENILLEIARKNGKTFMIAVLFVLLFFIEPKYSYFYSVAPDGSLSREIKKALEEIIGFNPHILSQEGPNRLFKLRRDDIECYATSSKYIPLNYSNSRLDGKLPNVFLVDEVGALPNSYALEAMRSGQLTILNKLGFVISTKYPTLHNPFEDEVDYAKKVLDKHTKDEKLFALLFEPDDPKMWGSDDTILVQSNPLAVEMDEMWEDLLEKRKRAIEIQSARENFLTKHCNIIYQGGIETFIPIDQLKRCETDQINWKGREVYVGVDLAMTNDNCAVAMATVDDNQNIIADAFAFIPEGRIEEKNQFEKIDYRRFIEAGKCFACGDQVVDYGFIEDFVESLEEKYGVIVKSIGYDRYNCLSSAQKWSQKYTTVEIRQHSDTLHPPTKLLKEKILSSSFIYEKNELLEINFENARCTPDTNMNMYVNKKKSSGKVDMVVALINATYLLNQDVIFGDQFFVQMI